MNNQYDKVIGKKFDPERGSIHSPFLPLKGTYSSSDPGKTIFKICVLF
jgi:hypothetical protein